MKIELWSSDLFDRESEPALEGEFTELVPGLAALWEHALGEGVQDDGKPTFTDFQLRIEGRTPISIPRDPLDNPELTLLRAFRETPYFIIQLALLHHAQLDRRFDFEPLLAALPALPIVVEQVMNVFCRALSITEAPLRERANWTCGPREGVHVRVITFGYSGGGSDSGGLSAWGITIAGLQFEGKPVFFGVDCEERDYAPPSWKVYGDASPATQPLRDALMAAGF